VPFAEKTLPGLSDAQQQQYARLLQEEDQDLFQWLVRKTPAPDKDLQSTVDLVLKP